MDDILELKEDVNQHYIADSQKKTAFEPKNHKKYEAQFYYKMGIGNKIEPMADADRTDLSRNAYWDFIKSLETIQQLSPVENIAALFDKNAEGLKPGETPQDLAERANWERLLSARKHATSAYRWNERLRKRVEAGVTDPKKDAMNDSYISKPSIREQTRILLSSPPQEQYSTSAALSHGLNIVLLLYTIGTQVVGILWTPDSPCIKNRWIQMSTVDCLWAAFLTKEAFLVTVPIFHATCTIGIRVSLGIFFRLVLMCFNNSKSLTLMIEQNVLATVEAQLKIYESMLLYLSSSWRITVLAQQLYVKEVNPSAKDWKATLTTTANMMYNLVLMGILDDDHNSAKALAFSVALSLFTLLTAMVKTSEQIDNICGALKDVNENRLDKFELALLLVKLQEIMLDEDVQYNFVEHFYSGDVFKLKADVEVLDKEDEKKIDMYFTPLLPENLAKKYGHDGIGEYGKDYKGEAKLYQPEANASSAGKAAAT